MDRARRTQQSYDRIAAQFMARYPDRSGLLPWMQRFKARLPSEGPVVDLGAGPCFDSAELRALGLRVISLDRSAQMLKVARDRLPGERVQADFRHLPLRPGSLAGVWACASLLHVERADMVGVLGGLRDVLMPRGALFMSLKRGAGEGWEAVKYGADAPRWFTYWSESELDAALQAAGFTIQDSEVQQAATDVWLVRIACRDAFARAAIAR